MKIMSVGQFKTHFSAALDAVQAGETIVVSYGRDHRRVAAMVPYCTLKQSEKRPLGLLKGKASARFAADFSLDDEALLDA